METRELKADIRKRAAIVDCAQVEPKEHPRFPGIYVKGLLTSADNQFASVNIVHVPQGGVIGHHVHPEQVETIFVIAGQSVLFLDGVELPFQTGQIIAVTNWD